ncbi:MULTISPECIES: hypothetical protein [unclassified Pseudomonas]|uniref:hypothetical protein n=1 Tax=unclassified Pseudomonas TaxID=196821 RepID=UPI00131D257F|nr:MULTISPECIES: hypothetical protein [unclassified Pseudomonas]
MSTPLSPVLASAFVVVATTDYEPPELLAVYLDEQQAKTWCAELQAYQETHPGWWRDDATDAERDDAYERLDAWRKSHPAGELAAGCMGFDVLQLPLADSPALLGYANARALAHFQGGQASSVDVVRDQETLWRSRSRDGDPIQVYLKT